MLWLYLLPGASIWVTMALASEPTHILHCPFPYRVARKIYIGQERSHSLPCLALYLKILFLVLAGCLRGQV